MLADRQHSLIGSTWSMADQVHGVAVLGDDHAGGSWPLVGEADVIVSTSGPVGVWAADCAPILIFGSAGTVVGAHGGWRGLAAGVVDVAVGEVTGRGESVSAVVVGPLIHACCYEFGVEDLAAVAAGVRAQPSSITGTTSSGAVALDVPAAVVAALARHGLAAAVVGPCTGCDARWYSHRVRSDVERHATVGWIDAKMPDRMTT